MLFEPLHGGRVVLLEVKQHAGVHFPQLYLDVFHGLDDGVDGVLSAGGQVGNPRVLAGAHAVKDLQHQVGLVLAVLVEGLLRYAKLTGEIVHAHGADSDAPEGLFTTVQQGVESRIEGGVLRSWRHPNALSGRKDAG